MNKHFTLLFCFLSINCDGFNDPESPYEEKYVVFGNISANQPMINDTIFVSRTASLDEMVDAEDLWVGDAEVTIFNDNMSAKASPVIGSAGRYQTDPSVVFMSGVKYHLEVNVNGKILTSETTTPNTIEISADSELKTYTCNDGTTLPISIINVDNVDENGGPILGKVDTLLYNYGQCFTGSFASYPLFMLDEVDKMSMDFRGDPSSALLEVLDPEQNNKFGDHYLEVDYDLSEVMFVATANTLNIPSPLQDRMEIIRISGYTEDEKLNIATRYLVEKQKRNNGLNDEEIIFRKSALVDIIRYYTREAGVRSLEREIAKICRKVAKELLLNEIKRTVTVTSRSVRKYLGVRQFRYGKAEDENRVGQVTGLAWTDVGGELLTIEAAVMPGKGKQSYTGKLGDVMQESIQAAMTVVRTRSRQYGIPLDFYQKQDVHIHVPEGATPKDGPSAGIGMCAAVLSAITSIPVRSDLAMTGEITLRGEVLPVGGLKEKLLAAHRGSGDQTSSLDR